MKFSHTEAETFVPDLASEAAAFERVTHLGIGAHQDDLEFMAYHGILECFGCDDRWFGGVTCTDGSGSARVGPYGNCTNDQLMIIRRQEQNKAAAIGEFGVMVQLNHPSRTVKDPADPALQSDLAQILCATRPAVVYTHNPADKHETHIGIVTAVIAAVRSMPPAERPKRIIGCEVWRDLDWLPDHRKVVMDVSGRDHLAAALNGVFDSQIAGGKRYDLATIGRRSANATFFASHATDQATQLIFGMDLTPLVADEALSLIDYVGKLIEEFSADVRGKLTRCERSH